MQGHSPKALVSLRADPCIARLSARFSILCCENPFTQSKTHRRTHMTQINESSRTELQSATTETKSRGGRRKGKAATAAGDRGATALHRVAETGQTTLGVSKMNTHSMGSDILNGATFGKFVL